MKIGDKMLLPIDCLETNRNDSTRMGEVVYIHPAHRFFIAEFVIDNGGLITKFRESYPIDQSDTKRQRIMRAALGAVSDRNSHYRKAMQ